MGNKLNTVAALLVAVLLLAYAMTFTVEEGRVGVLTILGRATPQLCGPGLHFRPPWPVGEVALIDTRTRLLEGGEEQVLTGDQNSLVLRVHVLWRVQPAQADQFWRKVRSAERFEVQLAGLLRSRQNSLFGGRILADLFPASDAAQGLEKLEQLLCEQLQSDCNATYGVDVLLVGINKLALAESVMESVHAKMSSERNRASAGLKAEGEAEARRIRAEAQAEFDKALAGIEGEARRIIGRAEAESLDAYKTLSANAELSLTLKKIETLEALLKERATVVLDPSVSPIDLLAPKGR